MNFTELISQDCIRQIFKEHCDVAVRREADSLIE